MKQILFPLTAVALVGLSACGSSKPEVVGSEPDNPTMDAINNAAPVALPPMVKLSKSFRCKDSSLIFVDFMTDDKTVNLRVGKKDSAPVVLKAEAAGKPFTADGGYSLEGSPEKVTVELPGKGSLSCKS